MKKLLTILAIVLVMLAVGCSSQDEETNADQDNTNDQANNTDNNDTANTEDEGSELEGEISLMMFEGGFGSDWVKRSAAEYEEMHPNVKVDITASPDIHTQLQTRFISGDVPDIMNPGAKVDIQGLVNEGEILALDEYLENPSYDDESVTWRDSFIPAQFKLQKDGTTYGVPTVFGAGYLWWYNEKMFEDNGWELPQTWDDVEDLKEKAAEKDIALFALQGMHPGYYFYGYYLPLVQKIGGVEAIQRAFNLEEGAWESDAFLKAAEITANLREDGYLLDGTLSLSHTDSQTQFFLGKSAFVTAGTWLEGEMQDVIPEDFKLRAINQPGWSDQSEEENKAAPITSGWGGAFYIPSKAKNPDLAADFLRYLSSKESVYKMMERGLASTVKGTEDAITSDALASSLEVIKEANGKTYLPTSVNDSYPELANNLVSKIQGVLTGDVTAEEFVQYAEEQATDLREDDSIEKVEFNW